MKNFISQVSTPRLLSFYFFLAIFVSLAMKGIHVVVFILLCFPSPQLLEFMLFVPVFGFETGGQCCLFQLKGPCLNYICYLHISLHEQPGRLPPGWIILCSNVCAWAYVWTKHNYTPLVDFSLSCFWHIPHTYFNGLLIWGFFVCLFCFPLISADA